MPLTGETLASYTKIKNSGGMVRVAGQKGGRV